MGALGGLLDLMRILGKNISFENLTVQLQGGKPVLSCFLLKRLFIGRCGGGF